MRLAFYKAFQTDASWLDRFIAICTLGKHSHVELVFSDGLSYSASPREKVSRFKEIKYNSKHWDFVDLDITSSEEIYMRSIASLCQGREYDYLGAIFSATPLCIHNSSRVFCSELVVNILRQSDKYHYLNNGCEYSPSELYSELDNQP